MKKIILLSIFGLLMGGCATDLKIKDHKASFLFDNAGTRAMNILAYTVDEGYFYGVVNRCKGNGDKVVYLYTFNKGDGPGTTSFYVNDQFGGAIDNNKMSLMKNRMKEVRKKDLFIVCWLFADDNTGRINFKDTEGLKRYIDIVIHNFDEYISEYVVALEADEYLSSSQVNELAGYIKSKTKDKSVGNHQLKGKYDYSFGGNIDKHYHQYGFNQPNSFIDSETKKVKNAVGKPIVAAEYDGSSDSAGAKSRGDTAMGAGASGTGNGRN